MSATLQPPPSTSVQPPGLPSVIRAAAREAAVAINCVQIGTVQSFAAATQTATVSINMKAVAGYGPGNIPITKPYPLLVKCPVFFPFGGAAALTMPIASGDSCIVLFNDRDIDAWWDSGEVDQPPNSPRVHSLSDGICLVGIRSLKNPLAGYSTTDGVLIGPGGIKLSLGGGKAGLANGTTSLLAAGDLLFTALIGWVDTHGDTPSAGTITAINAAKTAWDALLK